MGVAMDVNYRMVVGGSSVVGWPRPTTELPLWAYERIAKLAPELRDAGFSVVRMPPSCLGGAGVFSDGYDKFDDYDLSGTAFGDAVTLRRCVGTLRAHGMEAYGDLVLHQYGGGTAEGVYATKRFPKHASCFVGSPPRVGVDPVPDSNGNFAFGDMASYYNSTPGGYMYFGAIDAAEWQTETTGFSGYRVDDVKGTYAPVVAGILNAKANVSLYAVGEYFDGNPSMVGRYVNDLMDRRISVLDFATKFNVGDICNSPGKVWMGGLANIGWCLIDSATAMTFVESADTDNSPGEQVITNKMLGYAIILTFPGYPCVYYRDWATDPGCYGLKDGINNLVWIHENLAQGAFVPRLDNHPQVFVHERMGFGDAPGCIAAFNNDPASEYTVTFQTRYPANTRLHEYTGHYDTDVWTDSEGRLTITLPPNHNGLSFLVFALWVMPPAFSHASLRTVQTLFGAADLPGMPPAGLDLDGKVADVTPVTTLWAQAGTSMSLALALDAADLGDDVTAYVRLTGPDGEDVMPVGDTYKVAESGAYVIDLVTSGLGDVGVPYSVAANYIGQEVFA